MATVEILRRAGFPATTSHQLVVVIMPVIMTVTATICVTLRFLARRLQKSKYMLDDWLCLAAIIITWAFQGLTMATVFAGGVGLPIETAMAIDPTVVSRSVKITFVHFLLWLLVVGFVQLSILFFYKRIFGVSRRFLWACYTYVFLVSAFTVAALLSEVFACQPISKHWDPNVPGTCFDTKTQCTSLNLLHVILDLGIVALPIPMIWRLQMARPPKVVLSFLLCLGLVATILALLKTGCLINITGTYQEDFTDYLYLSVLLQALEIPIGIICCCAPSLRPVVHEIRPIFSSMGSRLLSYSRSSPSATGKSHSAKNTTNESSADFVRLNDSSRHLRGEDVESSFAQACNIELATSFEQSARSGTGIEVTNSFTISKHQAGRY